MSSGSGQTTQLPAGPDSATINAMQNAGKGPPSGKTGMHNFVGTNAHLAKDQLVQPEKIAPFKQGGQLDHTSLALIKRLQLSMNICSSSKPPTALPMYKGNPFALSGASIS